jgi:DNA helicase-2/ATP-dependent DNA helicase PcrA
MNMNKEQLRIVEHLEGTLLVVAGPGTGKTEVMIQRIVYLVKEIKASPEDILVLTFSKDTQASFVKRLQANPSTKDYYQRISVHTFESFGLTQISDKYASFGFKEKPKLVDNNLLAQIIDQIATKHKVCKKALTAATNDARFGNRMRRKNKERMRQTPKHLVLHAKKVLAIYKAQKQQLNRVDYEDMLSLWLDHAKTKSSNLPYKYLLVDELQDINHNQKRLIRQLAKRMKSSVLVGDRKQNIYGFRGAIPKHWQDLVKDLNPVKRKLSQSYRLSKQSLPFINALGSQINDDPPLCSDRDGLKPTLYRCKSADQQYRIIAKKIQSLLDKGVDINEIACLGRLKTHLSQLKNYLDSCGIDVIESYRDEDLKATIDVLQAMIRLVKWRAVPASPLGPKRRDDLAMLMNFVGVDMPMDQIYDNIKEVGFEKFKVPKMEKAQKKIVKALRKVIDNAATTCPEKGLIFLVKWLSSVVRKKYPDEHRFMSADLRRISIIARRFNEWSEVQSEAFTKRNYTSGVFLDTCNAAKGQEWKYVFVLHCVEGIFPIYHVKKDEKEALDEELRLFYVTCTRHSHGLYLLEAPIRPIRNKNQKLLNEALMKPSPWIEPNIKHLTVIDKRK